MPRHGSLGLTALIACAGSLTVSACALESPILALPSELREGADVLEVSGLRGWSLLWNRDIRFGPYRTTNTHVGGRSDDSTTWGVLDKNETWFAKRPVSFALDGAACPRWTARCLGRARRIHREEAVGIATTADGLGIDRRVVEDTSEEDFECALEPGAAPGWRLTLTADDPSGYGGVLIDDRGTTVARIRATNRQTGEPYTYSVPSPVGFVMETSAGDVAAVERAFQGKVILGRDAPPAHRCALATVAAALLFWTPLR